jgi:2-beta-glucuronyltransferase
MFHNAIRDAEKRQRPMDRILIVSGHDFRSPRKANIHFIARELAKSASVRFLSLGYSNLSLIKGDPRLELAGQANVASYHNGVECFLWKTFIHPCNIGAPSLRWFERAHFRYYRSHLPQLALSWIRDAGTVIVESGLGVAFIELIRQSSPEARIIYNASDDLTVLGCSPFLLSELSRVARYVDWARIPSKALARGFSNDLPLFLIPHGIDFQVWEQEETSPYESGIHAVSVGSMLFDESFVASAAELFPEVQFHIIGPGRTSRALSRANIHVYGEMKFAKTAKYIKHAKFCIAPYRRNENATYLADTSMKLIQYDFLGLPAVCPSFATGKHPNRFAYEPGDLASIKRAIQTAMRQGRHQPGHYRSWADVANRLINPDAYPDTQLLNPDGRNRATLSRAVA